MAFEEIDLEEFEVEKSHKTFQDETFIGVIKSIKYIEKMIHEKFNEMISFEFEDENEPSLDFFVESPYVEYKGFGRIKKNMNDYGVRIGSPKGQPDKIITIPSIIGHEVRFVKSIKETSNGSFKNWDLEFTNPANLGKDLSGNGSKKKEEEEDNSKAIEQCEADIIEILTECGGSGTEKDIIKGITAKYSDIAERKPIQAVRKETIKKMIEEGTIEDNVGSYTLA